MSVTLPLKPTVRPSKRTKRLVSEPTEGETVVVVPSLPEAEPYTPPLHSRYPAALNAEYHTLVDKELVGTLTQAEAKRLQEIMDEIVAIDEQYPNLPAIRMQKILDELRQIRAELEALPDV